MTSVNGDGSHQDAVIGVLLARKIIKDIRKGVVGDRILRLQKANEKAEATLYFFSMQDVDLDHETVNGMFYDNDKEIWANRTFPFPRVFYNRGGVSISQMDRYNIFKQKLTSQGTKYLNYIKGFNKWEIYKLLSQVEEVQPFLPVTRFYKSDQDLFNMLRRYKKLYLKACRGRKGYQVMRVEKLKLDRYEFSCFTKDGRIKSQQVEFHTLIKAIHDFFNKQDFIIQKAIDLPVIDNKILDMRAEMQRDGQGRLAATSICVRLSQPNAPITTHGESFRFEEFFSKFPKLSFEEVTELRESVENFLYTVYTKIESIYGPIGEMGIDFALDREKKIWFIECNSRPTKVSLLMAYDEETIEKSFLNPLEYAKYLLQGEYNANPRAEEMTH